MKYCKDRHNFIRVMPGDSATGPYVVHKTSEDRLSKFGKIVSAESSEAHIPLKEYNYKIIVEKYNGG